MNLFQVTKALQTIAKTHPNVKTTSDGSIYMFANANPSLKYGCFFLSQTTHRQDEHFDYYGYNIFYFDRLVDDLESNRLQIQSIGKDVISNTLKLFTQTYDGITYNQIVYQPFTERFADLVAGLYATVTIKIPIMVTCSEDFEELVVFTGDCQTCYDEGYAQGLSQTYEDGFESGKTYQKSLLTATQFTENGTYAREDGYSVVTVNVDTLPYYNSGWTDGYSSGNTDGFDEGYIEGLADCSAISFDEGFESGVTYQKSLLTGININSNGVYTSEDGYSAITVNVAQTGHTDQEIIDSYNSGYTSGMTDGFDIGYESGVTYQKSLLTGTAFTENGTYTSPENGYSSVTVDIDTQAYYNSGYSKGYDDGLAACSGTTPYLDTDTDSINTKSEGETISINVYSNTDWVVDSDEWITVIPVSGSGNGSIVVNIDSASTDRTGSIVISGDGITKTIVVSQTSIDYENEYFTIEVTDVIGGGDIIFMQDEYTEPKPVSVKINDGEWQSLSSFTFSYTPAVGDTIKVKGNNDSYTYLDSAPRSSRIMSTTNNVFFRVYGNIMSLIYGDNFENQTEFPSGSTDNFNSLFKPQSFSTLRDASNLILPATALTEGCYSYMFNGCSSLEKAPALPATNLSGATGCYKNMFVNCTSLTTAPALPATTLATTCYNYMFQACINLTDVPELPATTLADNCYNSMFRGCTSLTTAPELPATNLALGCYYSMFTQCTGLTTAPELPATTLAQNCYYSMFANCYNLATAPDLLAETLVQNCYRYMFQNCGNINYIKCLATNPATGFTYNWVSNVAPTGTFVKASGVTDWIVDNINSIPIGWTVVDYSGETDYSTEYLTFEAQSAGTLYWKADSSAFTQTIDYSKNDGEWTSITSSENGSGTTICTVVSGDKVRFRGTNDAYCSGAYNQGANNNLFQSDCNYNVYGNIMSLVYGDNFINQNTLITSYTFYSLFYRCTTLIDASNLVLPATTLTKCCYEHMFNGCSSLVNAPELPATTLAEDCYREMFRGCSELTTAPELPATALTESCYRNMFYGCTSLTTAPALPATTLAQECYRGMFYSCGSLTTAPELPATTLTYGCYASMFNGCSSLNNIKCLATDISAYGCTSNWLYGTSSTGTFVKDSAMTSWSRDGSGIPTNWTVQDAT